jgi:TolB-like protein/Flp pilus assembly protein TadD
LIGTKTLIRYRRAESGESSETDDMAESANHEFKGFEIHHAHGEVAAAEVRSELERILTSPVFGRAERPGRFLRFLVDRTLAGETNALTEWTLAVEVFDRRKSFDSTTDPIVRVEAGRLRRKLQDYYGGPGAEDPIVIDLPQRTYVPAFSKRKLAAEAPARADGPVIRRRGILVAGAVVALLGGVAAYWMLHRPARAPLRAEPGVARSIVVLPFKDLSPNHTDEYFCDGLTEELTETLSRVEGLQVVAGTSAFQFKGKPIDVREIGRRLNVQLVLEGSVRKDADRVRVTAQLVSAADGFHLWSRSYDRGITDILRLQEEIARGIAASVSANVSNRLRAANNSPNSAEAYELYLRGLYAARRWDHESLKAAVADFERCLALDANYAPAYAALAEYSSLLGVHAGLAPHSVMPMAKSAALKAVELDSSLSRAHASLGLVKAVYDWDWSGAELSFRRAFELDPADPNLHQMYVMGYLVPTGRLDDALREINEARTLDPISPRIEAIGGMIYYFQRDYDRALEQMKKALSLEPNFYAAHLVTGSAYEQKARFAEAIASLREGEAAWRSGIGPSMIGHAYALMGRKAEAEQIIRQLIEQSATRYISPAYIAAIYAGLNDADSTMAWLEKAYELRSASLVYLKVNPRFDRVRSDPRFSALLKKIRLN